jgi:hypothetical protein
MGAVSPCAFREGRGPSEIEEFGTASAFDVWSFQKAMNAWLHPLRMECTPPWLVGWYNSCRDVTAGGLQRIDADDGAIAFAIYSVPGYIDVVADHYARSRPESGFVDAATNEILERLRKKIAAELGPILVNTDEGPPYYHVQTIGAIAGDDQHLEAKDIDDKEWDEDLSADLEDTRDPKMWGTDPATRRKIFGVNVHPTYGGWYAYRILLILSKVNSSSLLEPLVQPAPQKFLQQEDAKRILHEYNLRHDLCLWRDITKDQAASRRYTPEEYFFFTETKPEKRKQFLEFKVAQVAPA